MSWTPQSHWYAGTVMMTRPSFTKLVYREATKFLSSSTCSTTSKREIKENLLEDKASSPVLKTFLYPRLKQKFLASPSSSYAFTIPYRLNILNIPPKPDPQSSISSSFLSFRNFSKTFLTTVSLPLYHQESSMSWSTLYASFFIVYSLLRRILILIIVIIAENPSRTRCNFVFLSLYRNSSHNTGTSNILRPFLLDKARNSISKNQEFSLHFLNISIPLLFIIFKPH